MISLSQISHELSEEEEIDVATHISNSMMIMKMLKKLESALSELNATNELLPVSELYKFFSSAGVSLVARTILDALRYEKQSIKLNFVGFQIDMTESRKLIEGIALFKNDSLKLSLNGNILETFNLFEKMMDTMFGSSVMSFDQATIDKSFKCSVTVDSERRFVKKFSLYCFNPSFG